MSHFPRSYSRPRIQPSVSSEEFAFLLEEIEIRENVKDCHETDIVVGNYVSYFLNCL
jgi:hypothetical protein